VLLVLSTMSPLMPPISLHQTVASWRNCHLEARHPAAHPGVLGTFPAPTHPRELIEANPVEKKSLRLKPELNAHTISSRMNESRDTTAPGNPSDSQDARNDGAAYVPKIKLRESDSSHVLFAMHSDSVSSSSRAQLPSSSTEKYPKELYGEDDCENMMNMTEFDEGEYGNDSQPKTAAERRAEKRKMKRFR